MKKDISQNQIVIYENSSGQPAIEVSFEDSREATHFRIWATARLNEYITKGFTIDSDRLKNLGGGNYWKELLEEIRDIRCMATLRVK